MEAEPSIPPPLSSFTYDYCPTHLFLSRLNDITTRLQQNPNSSFPITSSLYPPEVILGVLNSLGCEVAQDPQAGNLRLPSEVLARIFENVCDCWDGRHAGRCYETWSSSSLVCKSWRIEAQRRLFREVNIGTSRRLCQFVETRSPARRKVPPTKSIQLNNMGIGAGRTVGRTVERDWACIAALLSGIVGLETLDICGDFGYHPYYTPSIFYYLRNLSSITKLILSYCELEIVNHLYQQPTFALKSLYLNCPLDRHSNSTTSFEAITERPLERLSIISRSSDDQVEVLCKLLRAAGPKLQFLHLVFQDFLPDAFLPLFSLFTSLEHLEVMCTPTQLSTITTNLPSPLSSLTLLEMWYDDENEILYDDFVTKSLEMFENAGSLAKLEKLGIVGTSRENFVKRVGEGAKWCEEMQKKKVAVGFGEYAVDLLFE